MTKVFEILQKRLITIFFNLLTLDYLQNFGTNNNGIKPVDTSPVYCNYTAMWHVAFISYNTMPTNFFSKDSLQKLFEASDWVSTIKIGTALPKLLVV